MPPHFEYTESWFLRSQFQNFSFAISTELSMLCFNRAGRDFGTNGRNVALALERFSRLCCHHSLLDDLCNGRYRRKRGFLILLK